MTEYLLTAGPFAAIIYLLVSGRLVPAPRPPQPERPLSWWRRRWFQLRRRHIVDDLTVLRHELET